MAKDTNCKSYKLQKIQIAKDTKSKRYKLQKIPMTKDTNTIFCDGQSGVVGIGCGILDRENTMVILI